MRMLLLVMLAGLSLSAAGSGPQHIVFGRVFPQPGQIGLFVAAADGSGEHPIVSSRDMDYDGAWTPDGSDVQQITDNQWEEGTPAWQPTQAARPSR